MGRSKYTIRADGRRVATKTYKDFGTTHYSGRKMFYGKTDAEVEEKIRAFEEEMQRSQESVGKHFEEYAKKWWKAKQNEISPNSVRNYHKAMERAVDQFGEDPVKNIKPRDCLMYLNKYTDLSQKTLGNTRTVLKEILDLALIDGEIESNPCIALPKIKGNAEKKKPRVPVPDNEVKIVEKCKTESMQARFHYFILFTGLRRSECLALKGKDFDMQNRTVKIRRQIYFKNSVPHEKTPKTAAGERIIELTDNVIEILPDISKPEKYIWFPKGIPHAKAVDNWIREFRKEHNLTATPHQFRHSYASMLHSAEVDVKDVQHLLGHSTVAMTQDVYTHLETEHKKTLQSKLNNFIRDNNRG